jgi:2-keto-3-deoxy-L-rhamnonate aldolase RhmA
MLRNPLAETLKAGKLGLAIIIKQARSPDIALAAKTCGYDAVYVDLEHSVIPEVDAAAICVTALNAGITPLVRVPSHEAHYANRILDAGALGIVAPHVESAEEARHIVNACRFAPLGTRSVAGAWPHFAYAAQSAEEVRRQLNEKTTVVVMLETPQAVERAAEIAAVPGVDILHIGSTDLSDALGIPGQFGHPEIEKAFRKVIDACRTNGKIAGVGGMGSAPDVAKKIIGMGVRFITAGNEWSFMMQAARQRAMMLRELPLN